MTKLAPEFDLILIWFNGTSALMAHAAFVDGHWSNTGAAMCARLSAPYLFRLSDQARSGSVSLDFGIQLRHTF